MSIVTLDFETYYDKQFSVTKMTTEEYINDPQFEVIGVGIKIDDGETTWHTGNIKKVLNKINWDGATLLCHNAMFDGAILSWKYGIVPAYYLDTLCMARALHGVDAGGSLKALALRYEIGEKGDEVINAMGKRLADFSPADLDRYGAYCRNDVDLTYDLLRKMIPFPDPELDLIDFTLRMYTQPQLEIDDALLLERLEKLQEQKNNLLRGLMTGLGKQTEKDVKKCLSSNPKFAAILKSVGVPPPMKVSTRTGKDTFAFAKTDAGFIELQDHPDSFVQELCRVRLGTKSTIEESRIERFIDVGARNRGRIPIPLKYYGAHTGRWSGTDSVNFQNLPSRDKEKKALKKAIIAPEGYTVINSDSSQIEARILAWLAGETELVDSFRKGDDVYSEFASKIYKTKITKANVTERHVGKTCILGLGYGTGAKKLQHTLHTGAVRVDLSEEECKNIVDTYRSTYSMIKELWRKADNAIDTLKCWTEENIPFHLGNESLLVTPEGIQLPNTLFIRYPNIRQDEGVEDRRVVYDSRKGKVNLWGGVVVENVVQALARIVIGEQMIAIAERYRAALTVHDSLVYVVPDGELEAAMEFIVACMSTPPKWASDLPIACEAKYGKTYGDC